MLRCNEDYSRQILDILRVKEHPKTSRVLRLSVSCCSWRRAEKRLDERFANRPENRKIAIWLEALQEGLEVMDVFSSTVCIIVRTNIFKLSEAIKKDLYVKDIPGSHIAQAIHEQLATLGKNAGRDCPLELRVVFIQGGTPHPKD